MIMEWLHWVNQLVTMATQSCMCVTIITANVSCMFWIFHATGLIHCIARYYNIHWGCTHRLSIFMQDGSVLSQFWFGAFDTHHSFKNSLADYKMQAKLAGLKWWWQYLIKPQGYKCFNKIKKAWAKIRRKCHSTLLKAFSKSIKIIIPGISSW